MMTESCRINLPVTWCATMRHRTGIASYSTSDVQLRLEPGAVEFRRLTESNFDGVEVAD